MQARLHYHMRIIYIRCRTHILDARVLLSILNIDVLYSLLYYSSTLDNVYSACKVAILLLCRRQFIVIINCLQSVNVSSVHCTTRLPISLYSMY